MARGFSADSPFGEGDVDRPPPQGPGFEEDEAIEGEGRGCGEESTRPRESRFVKRTPRAPSAQPGQGQMGRKGSARPAPLAIGLGPVGVEGRKTRRAGLSGQGSAETAMKGFQARRRGFF